MSIGEQLLKYAQQIAEHYQNSIPHLEREILDLQAKLEEKKLALHSASGAGQRARNFVPFLRADFYCPRCWVTKEQRATLRPIPNDIMRCGVCGGEFLV